MDTFPRRAIAGIGSLIPSDILTYNEIDTEQQRAYMVEHPAGVITASQVTTFERLAHQHPLIRHYALTRETRPRKISDFLSLSEFQRLDLYQEFFRQVAVNYQMAVTIPSSKSVVIGIALNRTQQDFSERDRAVLDVIRPHLAQSYRNATERAARENGRKRPSVRSGQRRQRPWPRSRAESRRCSSWSPQARRTCRSPTASPSAHGPYKSTSSMSTTRSESGAARPPRWRWRLPHASGSRRQVGEGDADGNPSPVSRWVHS
jgi:hypothetical protein